MLKKDHILKLRKYPVKFFKIVLGVSRLEEYQQQIIDAIAKHDKVCIAASHSIGKTFILGRIVLWFLSLYRDSVIITTAPTHRQVVKLLWGELADAYRKSRVPIGGTLKTNELQISDKWYAIGFSPKKESSSSDMEQRGSTFQGFHALYVMVLFDEATGIPVDIWKMVEGILASGKIVKFVCVGNPTTKNCEFFNCFKKAAWKKIKTSCFDSPNMIANGFLNIDDIKAEINVLKTLSQEKRLVRLENYKKPVPYLVTAQWVIGYVLELGTEHALVVSKAFGEFPEEGEDVVIKLYQVERAMEREYIVQPDDMRFIGVDCARYGSDLSIITEIIGNKVTRKIAFKKANTMQTANEVVKVIKDCSRKTYVLVDGTGIGSGVVDRLNQLRINGEIPKYVIIIEVNFGQGCKNDYDKKHYVNIKAKIFKNLADDLENELDLIEDDIYLKELPNLKYKITDKGLIQMESKDDYKRRTGGQSPDSSDSLAIANYGRNYQPSKKEEETKANEYFKNTTIAPGLNQNAW